MLVKNDISIIDNTQTSDENEVTNYDPFTEKEKEPHIVDSSVIATSTPRKTLYQGFEEELSKIQDNNNQNENNKNGGGGIENEEDLGLKLLFTEDKDSSDKGSEETNFKTPSTTTTLVSSDSKSIDFPTRSCETSDNFSPFTPITLEFMKEEIKKNEENLKDLESVCTDSAIL